MMSGVAAGAIAIKRHRRYTPLNSVPSSLASISMCPTSAMPISVHGQRLGLAVANFLEAVKNAPVSRMHDQRHRRAAGNASSRSW